MVRQLRLHHLAKNLLLFVAFLLGGDYSWMYVGKLLPAFVALSCLAISAYQLNDVVDYHFDKKTRGKSDRPFAKGELSRNLIIVLFAVFFCFGIIFSLFLNWFSFLILILYFLLTIFYSIYLKKINMLDIFCLASFYVIRVFLGATVIQIPISEWLIAFSLFFFLSLAFVKRIAELQQINYQGFKKIPGRDYQVQDKNILTILGVACSYVSVLILALYVHSDEATSHYIHNDFLWIIVVAILFMTNRIWFQLGRKKIKSDILAYIYQDRMILFLFFLCLFTVIFSKL